MYVVQAFLNNLCVSFALHCGFFKSLSSITYYLKLLQSFKLWV